MAMAALERRVMRAVEQLPFRMIGWTLSAKSSAVGDDDEVETGDGDDSQRPVRRIEPFGVRSRPPSKVRTLQLRLGSSTTLFLGVASTNGYGPTDLDDGDTALYNAHAAEVRCKGDDVVVNGGTKKVARVDDTAKAGTLMATWMTQVETALNILAGGSVTPLSPTFVTTPGVAVISSGANNFKG
jgi:phage gp45-like